MFVMNDTDAWSAPTSVPGTKAWVSLLSTAAPQRLSEARPTFSDGPVGARKGGAELLFTLRVELHQLPQGERGLGRPGARGRLHGRVSKLPTDDAVLQIAQQVLELY